MACGLYEIRNKINGYRYVGSGACLEKRITQHRTDLRGGVHANGRLQNAWNKYGEDAFEFEALLHCDAEYLIEFEQKAIDQKSEYNIRRVADSQRGYKHSDESRARMSASQTGLRRPPEARANMSKAKMGHEVTKETRAKLSAAHLGRKRGPPSEAHRAELSIAGKAYWAAYHLGYVDRKRKTGDYNGEFA